MRHHLVHCRAQNGQRPKASKLARCLSCVSTRTVSFASKYRAQPRWLICNPERCLGGQRRVTHQNFRVYFIERVTSGVTNKEESCEFCKNPIPGTPAKVNEYASVNDE